MNKRNFLKFTGGLVGLVLVPFKATKFFDENHTIKDNIPILNAWINIVYDNGKFIAFNNNGKKMTSINGINWTSVVYNNWENIKIKS